MIPLIMLQAALSISLPLHKWLLFYCLPFFLAGSRLLLGGTVLVLYHCFRFKKNILCDIEYSSAYARMIIIGVYAKHMLRSWSLQYMSVIKMAFMFNCTPFIASAISFWLYDERISYQQFVGMVLSCMGVIPLLWIQSETGCNFRDLFFISAPDLALLLAIIAHCYGMQIARTLIRDKKQPASLTNGIRMLGGGVLCLLTAFWTEGWFPVTQLAPFTLGLLFLVVTTNILCHGWYLQWLRTHSVALLALTDFLEPFFTIAYGWLFLHEGISWHYLLAMVFVVLGLYLFYQEEHRKSMLIT